uniref:LTD domain-containing protein n=1 Tax=Ornithorhynchus anatinus TaxID=9258 RepID=A0A6I8PF41_ORNAN
MKERLTLSEAAVLQLQGEVYELSQRDPVFEATLERLQEAGKAEVKRAQEEMAFTYQKNFLELQMQLNNDRSNLGQAQEENKWLQQEVAELREEVRAVEKKLFSEEADNSALVEKLEAEHMKREKNMRSLEARLQEIQDLLLAKMKELSSTRERNSQLQSEISYLEDKLEEHHRWENVHSLTLSSPEQTIHISPALRSSDSASLIPSKVFWGTVQSDSSPSTISTSAPPASRTVSAALADWSRTKRSLLRDGSSAEVAKPPSKPIPAGESLLGQGSDYFQVLFSEAKKHQGSNGGSWGISLKASCPPATSSALGDIKIAEVDPDGVFVKLLNSSADKEEGIGGYILQQNVNGQAIARYRFPPNVRMKANSTVKVWAASAERSGDEADAGKAPDLDSPMDFLWKGQDRLRTTFDCTTLLCKPNGQAVAWYTPIHRASKEEWDKWHSGSEFQSGSEVTVKLHNHKESERTKSKAWSSHLGRQNPSFLEKQVQIFLKREKERPPTLFPIHHPWSQSPSSPCHPNYSPTRPRTPGQAGGSLWAWSRSQSAKPQPPPDVLIADVSRYQVTQTGNR